MEHNLKIIKLNSTLDDKSNKICTQCEINKPICDFNKTKKGLNSKCKSCMKNNHILRTFGLNDAQYKILIKYQSGLCKICDKHQSKCGPKGLVVDHDHKNGQIRGLLCVNCNTAIGLLKEDIRILKRAIEYILRNLKNVSKVYNPNRKD